MTINGLASQTTHVHSLAYGRIVADVQRFVHSCKQLTMRLAVIDEWFERAAQRRMLGGLDSRALADMGITPTDAAVESSKPFWRR